MAGKVQAARAKVKALFSSTRFAWYFIAKVVVFALIYWGIFFARPDAFNFASGYNNNPLTTFVERFYVPDDDEEYFLDDAQDLTEGFRQRAAEVDAARRAYLAVEAAEERAEEEYQAALDIFQASMDAEIEAYEVENVVPIENELISLEERIEALPFGSSEAPVLIGQKIELNEELLGHLTYIIENRIVFATDEAEEAFEAVRQARENARSATSEAGGTYRQLRGDLFDHFSATRNQMLYQIGFVDFLYFSACISTTTTFGDITANLPWVRLVVVLQIFAGIIILAGFLNSIRRAIG
jgi:hypothetical protein